MDAAATAARKFEAQKLIAETDALQKSLEALQQGKARFARNKQLLQRLQAMPDPQVSAARAKQAVVPVTNLLHRVIERTDPGRALVALGAGFFVERPVAKQIAYIDRKLAKIGRAYENVLQKCNENFAAIGEIERQCAPPRG